MHPQAQMFHNRLAKNAARLAPWVRRHEVHAYRLYDRDIPEVGLCVDFYDGQVLVAEFARKVPRPSQEEAAFQEGVRAAIAEVCQVAGEDLLFRRRERQHGSAQYQKLDERGHERAIREGGHRFLVNLHDYLDTGLFLDHRETRRLVQEMAAGQEVLNLFSYTGSFTVYAAAGGATGSLSVDMSRTYLAWAARNFSLNHLDTARHRLLRADATRFLAEARGDPALRRRFGLIVLDPPTFSNSKKMAGVLDIGRDHPALLRDALALLRPGGTLLFSSNFRGLQLRAEEVPGAAFTEISQRTLPPDFHDRRIHRSFLVRAS